MFTLSIEHAIVDLASWKSAFDRFVDARAKGGVVGERIRRPVGDPRHLVIELEFESKERAESFSQFLTNVVWTNPDASPALVGRPTTRILEPVLSVNLP